MALSSKPQPETRGLVLHAAWLRREQGGSHQLALWAEAETRTRPRRNAGDAAEDEMQPRTHPFGAKRSELGAALDRLWRISRPGIKPRTSHEPRRLTLWLPTAGGRPVPSPELIAAGWAVDPATSDRFDMPLDGFPLRLWHVNGLWLDAESAGTLLAGLPHTSTGACLASEGLDVQPPEVALGGDLRFWAAAGKLALDLLVRQRYLPGAIALPSQPYLGYSSSGPRVASYWDAALGDADVRGQFETLAQAMPDLCRAALSPDAPDPATAEIAGARALLEDFLRTVVNARAGTWLARDSYLLQMPREPRYSYGSRSSGAHTYVAGYSYNYSYYGTPTQQWLQGLAYPGRPLNIMGHDAKALLDGVNRWHAGLGTAGGSIFRLCFRLSPPGASGEDADIDEPEALDEQAGSRQDEMLETANRASDDAGTAGEGDETWRLDYFIQARDDLSLLVPLDAVWQEHNPVAQFVDRRFEHPHEHVLMALGQAARLFAPLERSLREARPTSCLLSGAEAYGFLSRALPLLEAADFGVLVPAWWQRARVKPALRLEVGKRQRESSGLFGLDAVVAYDWKVALGGDELTHEELERLAALKEPLVRVRGKWVELHSDDVLATLRFLREHANGMTLGDALRVSLTGEMDGGAVRIEEVRTDGWIGELLGRLRGGEGFTEVPQPEALRGTLRPYQLRGLSWLDFLARYGLGACLADDMGLGKCLVAGSRVSTLLGPIAIESLWEREIATVAPDAEGGEWGTLMQPVLVNTFDGCEIVAKPVRRIYRQLINEPCVETRLDDGSYLTSTRRHQYLTPGGWKMAGELQIGDLVAVPARTPHVGANDMPPELAELMAWQVAEGTEYQECHRGRFSNADSEVMNRFRQLAQGLGEELPGPRQRRTTAYVTSGRVYYLFEQWGYQWGKKSATKVVPQSVLEAPLESQRAFIAAMMDAEGHISKTHCEFASASSSITYAMRDMLRNFGIWLRIRVAMKAATNGSRIYRPYFVSTFGGNSLSRFAEQFHLGMPLKQAALERLAAMKRNSNVEGVPTQAIVAEMQERHIPLRSVGLRTVYEWQGMGRPLALSVASQLRDRGHLDLANQIDALAAPGIYWCRVKNITMVHHHGYVYDLEVPETHNYIANGIVTHNTVQLLSFILHERMTGRLTKPVLIVCPTSVVGNWEHEAARFAPELRVLVHHGAGRIGRTRAEEFAKEVAGHDLVLTTYSLLPRDAETLAQAEWGSVVLDEAQNIKNAGTKQSRTARRLRAPVRVALTGTPVENRLSELWSILDFLNPGYLGPHERFSQQFTYAIEKQRDAEATARLQTLVRPFILRRLKTDSTVIADLPEKIEIREYCPLTREQVTLYEAVVRDGLRRLEAVDEAMERRGIILAMLTRLKQVCNHPAHLLGDGSALRGRSGKLERLEELIEELLAEGDRALLFTQFTAMGDRLAPYLGERFGVEVLYLHGGVPRAERVRQVERFQSADGPPLFLLSLKAGGTGLNLTNANHVIHFDRWWNPAVENQATDRAFRIGQTRNVQVRKFVCRGTLEERIDAMIEQKRELAENVVGTGEGWITELSTAQLRDLFSLREDALAR